MSERDRYNAAAKSYQVAYGQWQDDVDRVRLERSRGNVAFPHHKMPDMGDWFRSACEPQVPAGVRAQVEAACEEYFYRVHNGETGAYIFKGIILAHVRPDAALVAENERLSACVQTDVVTPAEIHALAEKERAAGFPTFRSLGLVPGPTPTDDELQDAYQAVQEENKRLRTACGPFASIAVRDMMNATDLDFVKVAVKVDAVVALRAALVKESRHEL